MEYCSYSLSKLRNIVDPEYIPWPRCLHFIQHIMSGLAFLHRRHIIHRDIKPENVMVTDSFMCKIADFGLAKDQESYSNSRTNSDIIQPSGSLLYISPERLQNPNKKASESDDIYSCAMLVFKMITNCDLFCLEERNQDEGIFMDLKLWVVDKEYRHDLEEIDKSCPDIVKTVIRDCWHHTPSERKTFKIWAELLRDYITTNVTTEELRTADKQLNGLLEKGKSLTECDLSRPNSLRIEEQRTEQNFPQQPIINSSINLSEVTEGGSVLMPPASLVHIKQEDERRQNGTHPGPRDVSDATLSELSACIGGEWRQIALESLKLKKYQLDQISEDYQLTREKSFEIFVKWRKKNAGKASPQILLDLLRKREDVDNDAIEILEKVAGRVNET